MALTFKDEDAQRQLPNAFKVDYPALTQSNLIEIYKNKISEYIYEKKDGLNLLERYLKRGKVNSSCNYLSDLINFIWGSYSYRMGQTNYWWKMAPTPPLMAPVWLEEHLKPTLSKWINEQLA